MSEARRWSDHPLVQLTRVRYREFFREPEAVFWVFVFPILLAAGLGIAFRNRAPERTIIGVVATPGDTTPPGCFALRPGAAGVVDDRLRGRPGAPNRRRWPCGGPDSSGGNRVPLRRDPPGKPDRQAAGR